MKTKDLIQLFLMHQQGAVSNVTLDWYGRYLKPIEQKYGEKECSEITFADLQDLFLEKRGGQYSMYTLANYIRVWKRLFAWAFDEGFLDTDPAGKLKRLHLPPKSPAAISDGDIQKLLQFARLTKNPERDYALLLFLNDTGARVGGVAGLRLENLDLTKRRAVVAEKGRGGRRERLVFFSKQTAEAIARWLRIRPDRDDDTRLFLLVESGIFQVLKRLAKLAMTCSGKCDQVK